MDTGKKVISFLKTEANAHRLDYLHSRWQDEKEYEDWADYEKEMEKLWDGDGFIKGTKRPLGFKIKDNVKNRVFHITLKVAKKNISMQATVV